VTAPKQGFGQDAEHRRASQLRRRRLHLRGAEGQRGLQPAGVREVLPEPEVLADGRAAGDGLRGVRQGAIAAWHSSNLAQSPRGS
jgi:hypothetical protein